MKLRVHGILLIGILLLAATLGLAGHLAAEEPQIVGTVLVNGSSDQLLAPDTLVGPYNQPEWTEHRRFSATRGESGRRRRWCRLHQSG